MCILLCLFGDRVCLRECINVCECVRLNGGRFVFVCVSGHVYIVTVCDCVCVCMFVNVSTCMVIVGVCKGVCMSMGVCMVGVLCLYTSLAMFV